MSFVFNNFFYEPLLNFLIWLIKILPFHDIGVAVIILTIIVRLIIFPFTHKATVAQNKMKTLEPELKDIKEKFKKDNQEQAKKTMELYKKHGINPLTSFVVLLVQLPIIYALFKIFRNGANFDPSHLYSFTLVPEYINMKFLGLIDIGQKSYFLAVAAAVTQFFQMKLAMPLIKDLGGKTGSFKDNLAKSMSIQFKYVMPVMIFFIAGQFVSAVALYWTTMNIFATVHEIIVKRQLKNPKNNGTASTDNKKYFGRNSQPIGS